jgi:hypothetical protein
MQIANWTITDQRGPVWSVACHCGYKTALPKALLELRPPKCKRCGASAAKPVQAPPPITQLRAGPGQPFTPVDKPVDKMASPQIADGLFGVLGLVPVTLEKPEPKPAKPSRYRLRVTVPVGYVCHRLTVLGDSETQKGRAMVRCRCECGVIKDVHRWHVAKGTVQSCGCSRDSATDLRHNMRTVALPGDVFGSLKVIEEAEKQGKNRTVIAECTVCAKRWKVGVQNLRRSSDDCACADRWRQSSAGKEQAQEIKLARIAKRAEYDRVRKVREIQQRIRITTARLAKLQAQLDALTPAATVAQ